MGRSVVATAVTTALMLGGTVMASAAPAPSHGQVAGGTVVTVPAPEVKITDVSAGSGGHYLVTADNGTVWAYGLNLGGAFGDGTTTDSVDKLVPVRLPAGATVTSVTAGLLRSLALDSTGAAYQWGTDSYGEPGFESHEPMPVPMPDGVTFREISAGTSSYALATNGKAYAWGSGDLGALGNGDLGSSSSPVEVQVPVGVTFTAIDGGDQFAIALDSEGNVYGWGRNYFGEISLGIDEFSPVPVRISALPDIRFTQVIADTYHGAALGADGSAYIWGSPSIGDDRPVQTALRMQPPAGVQFVQLASGNTVDYALGSDGLIYAWGSNNFGELGDGTSVASSVPIRVQTPDGVRFTTVTAAAASATALTVDGRLFGWGAADFAPRPEGTIPAVVEGPEIIVTGISFDGIDGTNLVDNGDGTWNVVSPEHPAGPVDVVLAWTLGGIVQAPIVYADGFSYDALLVSPSITDPQDQNVRAGGTAVFQVTTTGSPMPTVVWNVSRDGGKTWEPISSDPAAIVETDGQSLFVRGSDRNSGFLYRATATNDAGSATSLFARLTVTTESATDGPAGAGGSAETAAGHGTSGPSINTSLAVTGLEPAPVFWLVGAFALLLGCGIVAANRVAKRRLTS